jgi:hypothetical protein
MVHLSDFRATGAAQESGSAPNRSAAPWRCAGQAAVHHCIGVATF